MRYLNTAAVVGATLVFSVSSLYASEQFAQVGVVDAINGDYLIVGDQTKKLADTARVYGLNGKIISLQSIKPLTPVRLIYIQNESGPPLIMRVEVTGVAGKRETP
jgi:hypothetical protein